MFTWLSLSLFSCKEKEIKKEEELPAPEFLFSTPENNAVNVALNSEVSLIYNTPIVQDASVRVLVNDSPADTEVSDRKLLLKISLGKNKTYKVNVPSGAIKNKSGAGANAVSFQFTTLADSQLLEAETATLTGNAAVESSLPNFSGSGYVNQKDGDISFKFTVPEGGKFKLSFRFSNGNSKKENDLVVNNVKLSSLVFDATQDWKILTVEKVILKAGENTITLRKNWGWIYLDYIRVAPADPETPFAIAPAPVTPNPSKEAVNLYNFLKTNFGNKVISGAMANYSTGMEEAQWMYDNTGKWPAVAGFDLINYTRQWSFVNYKELVQNADQWWKNKGIVTLMWHWRDPLRKTDEFYTDKTGFDVSKISNTSSDEYKAMLADIDSIAVYLKELQAKNIPVLWRPLHEASGKWFWWGAKGAEPCKKLWILMYDRLTHHHKLNNLIWVWTSDAAGDAAEWYPGHEYVDIIGMDIYPGENQHGSQYIAFDKVKSYFGGRKILALTECGSVPDINSMFDFGDTWSWFMPWNGDYTRSDKHNGATYLKNVFNHSKVLTRSDIPDLK